MIKYNGISLKEHFDSFDSELEGKILIASPKMKDPCFQKTIVYLCIQDDAGVVGVILNKELTENNFSIIPMQTIGKTQDAGRKILLKHEYPMLWGGPVNQDTVLGLSVTSKQIKNFDTERKINIHINYTQFLDKSEKKNNKIEKYVLARGLSSWTNEQLTEEIENNEWFVSELRLSLLFSKKRYDKWDYAIKNLIGITEPNLFISKPGYS